MGGYVKIAMEVKRWRPKDWFNEYAEDRPDGENPHHNPQWEKVFEDGADAMLDALFEMAKQSPTGKFVIDSNDVYVYPVKCQ